MQIFELAQKQQSTLLIESVCHDLTKDQRRIVEGIVSELRPLFETTLTAAQIQQIFQLAQKKQAAQGGVGRTTIGRAVDATKAVGSAVGSAAGTVNRAIDGLGRYLQTTAPVQYFDQKFEKLKTDVTAKLGADSAVIKTINQLGQYARANPGKTAFVIGTLTAVAALTTGPGGGAVAGQVLRGAVELLKGEKLSTALGKGIKTAAFGYLTGSVLDSIGDWFRTWTLDMVQYTSEIRKAGFSWSERISWNIPGYSYTRTTGDGLEGYFRNADADQLSQLVKTFKSTSDPSVKEQAYNAFRIIFAKAREEGYFEGALVDDNTARQLAIANNELYQDTVKLTKGIAAAAQGAVQAATGTAKTAAAPAVPAATAAPAAGTATNQVRERYTRLTNKEIREIFAIAGGQITEGPVLDKLKSFGTKLTTKQIDTAALLNHWKFAKSPTDSGLIAKILRSNNVSDNVIKDIFDEMNIEIDTPASGGSKTAPAAAPAAAAPAAATPAAAGTPVAAATTYNFAKAAADKLAKGQADQQAALQQVKANTAANTVKSAADGKIKADADAAKAKPGFQQTAADKLAIKTAAARGIRENKQILKIYETMTPEQRKQLIKNLEIIDDRDRPFTYPAESLKRQRKI